MRILLVIAALLLPLVSLEARAAAQGDDSVERVFSEIERQIIEEYYRNRYGDDYAEDDYAEDDYPRGGPKKAKHAAKGGGGLPPGLAKRDRLPPGLEKHLERWGRLPPGLEKRYLPDDLIAQLGPRSDLAARQVVGADVLLVDVATGVILDILRDVIAGTE